MSIRLPGRFLDRYINTMLLQRQKNPIEKLFLRGVAKVFSQRVARQRSIYSELIENCRISILSPDQADYNLSRRLKWGDYWARYELTKALGELGYLVTNADPDVVIHLFGEPTELPAKAFKIIWIYSHPERITPRILSQYDRIFCLSSQFNRKIRDLGFDSEWMPAATARRPRTSPIKYDVVFVGNTRSGQGRQVVLDLGNTSYNLQVWGHGWDKILPQRCIGGEYFDYTSLAELYSSALVSLNDHWPEMNREGFVAIRVFDILGSGGFCISDSNPGINELFGDVVPQYSSSAHLRELIDYYISNPEARLERMHKGRLIALSHTWQKRAQQLLRDIDILYKPCKVHQHREWGKVIL